MVVKILDIVIAGLLMGGIYALIAVGLSLQFGVARVLNIAHGEFIMLGAFITWWLYTNVGINPLVSLAICGPIIFIVGFILYRTLFTRLRTSSPSPAAFEGNSMLACFGLLFIIQNVAILIWGADIKGYSYLAFPVNFGGAIFAANRLITLGFAIVIGLVFYLFLARTRLGKAIRAAAQDPATAGLMGVNINQVLALCFGFGALMAGLGGTLIKHVVQDSTNDGARIYRHRPHRDRLRGVGQYPWQFYRGSFTGSCWQHRNLYRAGLITGCLLCHLHASAPGEANRYFGEIEKWILPYLHLRGPWYRGQLFSSYYSY